VETVARRLLGSLVVAESSEGTVTLRLTEVEAYAGVTDPASHAWRGPTPRTQIMFGPPGFAYVYFTYGMHECLNVVTGPDGTASAVLLRAGEVLGGLPVAVARRPGVAPRDLARGPARLTKALGVTRADIGADLLDPGSPLRLEPGPRPVRVAAGPRVGISRAAEVPWRFWIDGDPTVSVYRAHKPRRSPGA
jgi:DNA-3-methyladenine glycosylase